MAESLYRRLQGYLAHNHTLARRSVDRRLVPSVPASPPFLPERLYVTQFGTCRGRISSVVLSHVFLYRGTSITGKRTPLGPYRRPIPRVLGGFKCGQRFLMGEVLLYTRYPCGEMSETDVMFSRVWGAGGGAGE